MLWSIGAAVVGLPGSAYKVLSAYGHIMPSADGEPSFLAITLNVFMLTMVVTFVALVIAGFFLAASVRHEKLIWSIVKLPFVALMGTAFVEYHNSGLGDAADYTLGILLLAAIPSCLSPIGRWIDRHSGPASVVVGMLVAIVLFVMPNGMRGVWTWYFDRPDFTIVPLSSMNGRDWFAAILGGGIYVMAFISFQQWRTEGKWLKQIGNRIRSES